MALLSVQKTPDYDPKTVARAIAAHMEALEVAKDLRPGMRVLLKPNLLAARRPQEGVTTHPAVVQGVVDWLQSQGIRDIVLADSPGGFFTLGALRGVYAACGMAELVGVELNEDTTFTTVSWPNGRVCKAFGQIGPMGQADYIINLGKVKTHAMTTISAGIKNLFGTVPGLQKPELHCRYPNREDFGGMLLDLAELVKPDLTILDGVVAMEGDGPSGGTLRSLGATFASRDLYSQDWYLCREVMGLDPAAVPMLAQAKDRGLVEENPVVRGDTLEKGRPFTAPKSRQPDFMDRLPQVLRRPAMAAAKGVLEARPVVENKKCIGCGRCAQSCPTHTITVENGKAKIHPKGCIRCYCCHEMCPVQAVKIRRLLP